MTLEQKVDDLINIIISLIEVGFDNPYTKTLLAELKDLYLKEIIVNE